MEDNLIPVHVMAVTCIFSEQSHASATPVISSVQSKFWLQRFAHMNYIYLQLMLEKEMVVGIPKTEFSQREKIYEGFAYM